MIQRAASTSGACRGERDSDRFGEGGGGRGRDERGDEDGGVESIEGEGGGVCVGLRPKGRQKKGRWKWWRGEIQEKQKDKKGEGRQKY